MKKYYFMLLLSILVTTVIFSFIPTTSIGDFQYPIDMLKKTDHSLEEAHCEEVIDTNSIRVTMKNTGKKEIITFLSISEQNNQEASSTILEFNRKFLEGKDILLSYDWKSENEKDELIAYVWLPYATQVGGYTLLWNEVLLLNGYAEIDDMAVDLLKAIMFFESYEQARKRKLGIWKKIETEKPINFCELPEIAQDYLVQKYGDGFEKKEQENNDSQGVSKEDFLDQLMLNLEWGLSPSDVREKVNAKNLSEFHKLIDTSGYQNCDGSNIDQIWTYSLEYKIIIGSGEKEGLEIPKLEQIEYTLKETYTDNEVFDIYTSYVSEFNNKLGLPDEHNKSENYYIWFIGNEKTLIKLSSKRSLIYLEYRGDFQESKEVTQRTDSESEE